MIDLEKRLRVKDWGRSRVRVRVRVKVRIKSRVIFHWSLGLLALTDVEIGNIYEIIFIKIRSYIIRK